MEDATWNSCSLVYELLALVRERMTDRQRRLFAVACCRRYSHLMFDARTRNALDVAQHFADGSADDADLAQAEQDAAEAYMDLRDARLKIDPVVPWTRQAELLAQAAGLAVNRGIYYAEDAADCVRWAMLAQHGWGCEKEEEAEQCRLLREIVPTPYRSPILEAAWRADNDRAVEQLASYIEREGAYDVLPILGDALEEAGCADERILSHCRDATEHAPGCWVVDLALGRI